MFMVVEYEIQIMRVKITSSPLKMKTTNETNGPYTADFIIL
jgi:hypothetical protein